VPDNRSLFVDTPWATIYACGDWIGYDTPAFWMERATVTGIASANRVLSAYDKPLYEIIKAKPPSLLVKILSAMVWGIRLIVSPIVSGLRWLRQNRKKR
jgi:hypothetical protein